MSWLSHIGGKLKSDPRYSIGLVYNTFPWPDATAEQREHIEALAQDVLDARAAWPTSSLADLYDPDTMPANLRKAHHALRPEERRGGKGCGRTGRLRWAP